MIEFKAEVSNQKLVNHIRRDNAFISMTKDSKNIFFRELIEKAKAGEKSAFTEIYTQLFTPVFRYIYIRVKNKAEAEDIAQGVFLKAYQALPNYKEQNRPLLAYLFTIARNSIIDHWRKAKNAISLDDSENGIKEITDPESGKFNENFDKTQKIGKIKEALKKLTPDQKEVVSMKYMSELSHKEIAAILGKSEDAIRQLACRGLKTLRENFKISEI